LRHVRDSSVRVLQRCSGLVKNEQTVHASDTLQLKMAPSGGMVALFSPAK